MIPDLRIDRVVCANNRFAGSAYPTSRTLFAFGRRYYFNFSKPRFYPDYKSLLQLRHVFLPPRPLICPAPEDRLLSDSLLLQLVHKAPLLGSIKLPQALSPFSLPT